MEYENGTNFSVGATTDNLPPGVLYRVKATYKYRREDVDELSFDVGDIIRVVEYDDPEEQVCAPLFKFWRFTATQCLDDNDNFNCDYNEMFCCSRNKAG